MKKNKFIKILYILTFSLVLSTNAFSATVYTQEEQKLNEEEVVAFSLKVNDTYSVLDSLQNHEEVKYIPFGKYTQKKYSLEKEPINWILLEKKDGKAFFISKNIIDVRKYNASNKASNWQQTDIKKWLNNDFLNTAFSYTEKNLIVENPYRQAGKVFFLTEQEAEYYLSGENNIASYTNYTEFSESKSDTYEKNYWLQGYDNSSDVPFVFGTYKKENILYTKAEQKGGIRPCIIVQYIPTENDKKIKETNIQTQNTLNILAPIYLKDTIEENFIYSYYDDSDEKRMASIKIKLPVYQSQSIEKANLINAIIQNQGKNIVKEYSINYVEDFVHTKNVNVIYKEFKEEDGYEYYIPFVANNMPICTLHINLANMTCYSE